MRLYLAEVGNICGQMIMRFKKYMKEVPQPGQTASSTSSSQSGPSVASNQLGTIQQGQTKLPPGVEQEEWYQELMKTQMPEEWKSHFVNQSLVSKNQDQQSNNGIGSFAKQVINKSIGHDVMPLQGM